MDVKRVDLDAKNWNSVLDFYKALFVQIGAPDWHGESVAALIDSMVYGGINQVEPPYAVYVKGLNTAPSEIADEVEAVKDAIQAARDERRSTTGTDVPISIEVV